MVRTKKLPSILFVTALLSTIPGSPTWSAPQPKLPKFPSRPGEARQSQLQLKQESGGGFLYFLAALATLGGVGLGVRALGTRVQHGHWTVNRELWGGAIGAILAGIVAAAFMTAFGSPNGKPSGAFWLGAVFVICSAQLGRRAASEEVRTIDAQRLNRNSETPSKMLLTIAQSPSPPLGGEGHDPNSGDAHE